MNVVPVRIASVGGCERAAWAEGRRATLPAALVDRIGWRDRIDSGGNLTIPSGPSPVGHADAAAVRELAAFTETPPAFSRLPISYQRVPARARSWIASAIGRTQRRQSASWARFPAWPLDLTADLLADLAADGSPVDRGAVTPVVLTHDIDSPEGLARLVREFLPIEEAAGARSTSYVVPCGFAIDEALVREVRARGHEVGVHGYDHSNRTPFAADAERRRRLDAAQPFAARHGAGGYRAPSLLRTRALLGDLASRYRYDSSVPTSGGPFPVPNNGCATARPFVLEGIVELPLSMPRDGSLRFLGYRPDAIARLWIECADAIASAHGVVVLLTHCERHFSGTPAMQRAYRTFIDHVAAAGRFRLMPAIDVAVRDAA